MTDPTGLPRRHSNACDLGCRSPAPALADPGHTRSTGAPTGTSRVTRPEPW